MRDAQLLILDEPTAALDARAEFEVFQRFKELSEGKTAVLISHRFSSVRMADRILVLADGRIEAAGTHEELLAAGGRYAELFELQAAGYEFGRTAVDSSSGRSDGRSRGGVVVAPSLARAAIRPNEQWMPRPCTPFQDELPLRP